MHVGDGTWDSSKDTFLLPNIQGLNFQTLRYNGKARDIATGVTTHTELLLQAWEIDLVQYQNTIPLYSDME